MRDLIEVNRPSMTEAKEAPETPGTGTQEPARPTLMEGIKVRLPIPRC